MRGWRQEHRAALIKAIDGQGMKPVAMENDAAKPAGDSIDSSLGMVREATGYIGVISHMYGQIPEDGWNPEGLSLTEMEFRSGKKGRIYAEFDSIGGRDAARMLRGIRGSMERWGRCGWNG
ncbi:MAG: DUF4062 domain-containing protein [Bryobacterales bacterium]|nr:DUF4062 domain-containing protein [Bryobacterales bacterium]